MIKMNKLIQTLFNVLLKVNQPFHQIFQKKDRLNLKAGQLQIHVIKIKILQIFKTKRTIQILQIVINAHSRKLWNFKKYQLNQLIQIRVLWSFKVKIQIKKVKWMILRYKTTHKLLKAHQVKVSFLRYHKRNKRHLKSLGIRVTEIRKRVDLKTK